MPSRQEGLPLSLLEMSLIRHAGGRQRIAAVHEVDGAVAGIG